MSEEQENIPTQGISATTIVLVVVLILLATAAFAVFTLGVITPSQDTPTNYSEDMANELNKADSLLTSNDFLGAAEIYDELIADAQYEADEHTLTIRKAHALFANADPESSDEAIQILGNLISSEEVEDMFRGWATSELLQFYYSSQRPDILAQIKALPVFAEYNTLSDSDFLNRVAQFSDSLYPTPLGKIHLAIPYARQLTYDPDLDSSVAQVVYAEQIETLTNQSQLLEAESGLFTTPYHTMMLAHYRGILLSAGANVDSDLTSSAQAQFDTAVQIANTNPDNRPIQELSWYTHFYYAALALDQIDVDANQENIVSLQLAQLTQKLETAADTSLFETFARSAHNNPASNNWRLFSELSNTNVSFSDLLESKFSLVFN